MQKYVIVTDSCANLSDEIISLYNIPILSLSFKVNDEEIKSYNGKKTDLKLYYDMMRRKERITTSPVNSDEVYIFFNNLLKEGYDILYIGFSAKLSNTFNACRLELDYLQKKHPERKLFFIDSISGSLGLGLLVEKAYEMKTSGKTIDEVYIWVEKNKYKVIHLFTVDTLYHFYQGGRVGKTGYLISKLIGMKAILHCNSDGRLEVIGRAIGRKKALVSLVDKLIESIEDSKNQVIYISHSDCLETVEIVKNLITNRIEVKGFVVTEIDMVVGAHTGSDAIALFYFGNSR